MGNKPTQKQAKQHIIDDLYKVVVDLRIWEFVADPADQGQISQMREKVERAIKALEMEGH